MTVAELIKELSKCNPDAVVLVSYYDGSETLTELRSIKEYKKGSEIVYFDRYETDAVDSKTEKTNTDVVYI